MHLQFTTAREVAGAWGHVPSDTERMEAYTDFLGVGATVEQTLASTTVETHGLRPRSFRRSGAVPFYVVPKSVVQDLTRKNPLPAEFLSKYLEHRPGILDDDQCDIFCQNTRSEQQVWKDFSLFEQVQHVEPGVLVVFPTYLELFHSNGQRDNIEACIRYVIDKYPDNPVSFQWNHDDDAASMPFLNKLPANVFVLNFNTSNETRNDILLPFWAIQTNVPPTEKRFKAGFIGYIGGVSCRRALKRTVYGRDGYFVHDTTHAAKMLTDLYQRTLGSFKFSLCPRGGGLSSYRFYESIQCGSIPVLFSDGAVLPYSDIGWEDFSVRLPEAACTSFGVIDNCLSMMNAIPMTKRLMEVRERFSLLGVQQEIYRRVKEWLA
mgnify:CR=1 FL=1